MRPSSRFRQCVLFLAIILSVTIGCAGKDDIAPIDVEKQAFADLREDIREVIEDPARADEAIKLVGVLQEDLAALRRSVAERRSRIAELNADYDTSRADFEAFLQRIEAEVGANRRRASESHLALLATVTAEERSALAKTRTRAMKATIRTMQAI